MEVVPLFATVAGVIGIGFLAELIFQRTKIPDVIILIIIGILLRHVLGWIVPGDIPLVEVFTTFTLIFLLFQGALNIDLRDLRHSLGPAAVLTITGFAIATITATIVGLFAGLSLPLAIFLGVALGGTASAVVVPMVKVLKIEPRTRVIAVLESAFTDVLCIVGAVTMIGILLGTAVGTGSVIQTIAASFGVALAVGLITGITWTMLLHRYVQIQHAYMLTIAAVLATYAIAESPFFSANGAIAALVFGVVLGNAPLVLAFILHKRRPAREEYEVEEGLTVVRQILPVSARRFYSEVSFFVKVFFFVYIGILLDFTSWYPAVVGLILTLIFFGARPLAVWFAHRRQPERERVFLEALGPKGLAPVVIVELAVQQGVPGIEAISPIIAYTVVFSIFVSSIAIALASGGWFRGAWRKPTLFSRRKKRPY